MTKINRAFFFQHLHTSLFPKGLNQGQVDGHETILDEWEAGYSDRDDRWLAYMLATVYHEVARTMQPIEEYGKGKGRKYGEKTPPYGHVYYGRGYVQLTWDYNYKDAGKKIGVDLLQYPEKALEPEVATKILFRGMTEGWFTGKKLADYFSPDKEDWVNARRIVNALDHANQIAGYGHAYYAALSYTT